VCFYKLTTTNSLTTKSIVKLITHKNKVWLAHHRHRFGFQGKFFQHVPPHFCSCCCYSLSLAVIIHIQIVLIHQEIKKSIMGATASKESSTSRLVAVAVPKSSPAFFSNNTPSVTQCDGNAPPPPPPLPPLQFSEPSSTSLPIKDADTGSGGLPEEEDAIAKAASFASAIANPGPYESAAMDCKRLVSLDTYDGFRCDINKQLSPHMAVVHSFWLGTNLPDGRKRTYSWLTQVADNDSLYMARLDPEKGSIDGRIHKSILGGLAMFKLQLGLSAEGQTDQALADVDFGGMSWTGNLKYGSMGGGLIYGCNYYQSITPKLSMGGEGMYISANNNLLSNYTVKYSFPAPAGEDESGTGGTAAPGDSSPASTICANFNSAQSMLALNYKRVVTPNRVTLGAELACNPMTLESQVVLGAEFKWSRSKLQLAIDGSAKMQSVFEAKLGKEPGQPSLTLCAELDHLKDEMRFGYGLSMDG
jgi:mitochondrial import receptor subunit TOM40